MLRPMLGDQPAPLSMALLRGGVEPNEVAARHRSPHAALCLQHVKAQAARLRFLNADGSERKYEGHAKQ